MSRFEWASTPWDRHLDNEKENSELSRRSVLCGAAAASGGLMHQLLAKMIDLYQQQVQLNSEQAALVTEQARVAKEALRSMESMYQILQGGKLPSGQQDI